MASNIISSFTVFSQKFNVPVDDERTVALKRYFARGGVISAVKSKGVWPKIVYPTPARIKSQTKELESLRVAYDERNKGWKKRLKDAQTYHSRHQLKKFSEPLYWKHVSKTLVDSDYRADFNSVKLPVHLVSDSKWKPMVKMFIEDLEYRKNLTETVQQSIVYKNDNKVAKYADQLQALRSEVSEAKITELDKKLANINAELDALKIIEKWASE
ncbi:MAG: hypothetical protein COV47_04055 [Candidatus Diapherotrites archaeon CG11_big_fil_rev_8_21_14_0_20_37_9]|nr:MAG: hypothetical protein COV47_04055 [Candidatus Diapherotrites archaeon CG11_big_fil_rev_8_21_14_0_20_37_9]